MAYDFYRLKNGVRVILVPMEGVESVGVGVFVEAGSRYETAKINGISHFLEHMVFKGTKKFPTHKDTSYLEGLGAIQNAWTSSDATAYWTKIPANRWKEGLELVKELALYPTIPAADLEIERGVILEEINRREDRPDEIVEEELMKLLYPGNPLGWTTLGTPEVIKSVSRDDFVKYHADHYVAGKLVIALAGKLDKPEIKKHIDEWFANLPVGKGEGFEPINQRKMTVPLTSIYKKKLAAQAHICLGVPGLTVTDPRRFALSTLTSYLGQGLSSRLFIELREKRGLCYAVSAFDEKYTDTGFWGVYAGLNISKLEEAIGAIWTEVKRMKEVKLTSAELEAAKEKLRGPLLFSMENPISQMNFYAKQALDKPDELMSYDAVVKSLMQVTIDDVQKVARDLFDPEKLHLAIVGPVEERKRVELVKLLV